MPSFVHKTEAESLGLRAATKLPDGVSMVSCEMSSFRTHGNTETPSISVKTMLQTSPSTGGSDVVQLSNLMQNMENSPFPDHVQARNAHKPPERLQKRQLSTASQDIFSDHQIRQKHTDTASTSCTESVADRQVQLSRVNKHQIEFPRPKCYVQSHTRALCDAFKILSPAGGPLQSLASQYPATRRSVLGS